MHVSIVDAVFSTMGVAFVGLLLAEVVRNDQRRTANRRNRVSSRTGRRQDH